MIHFFIYNLIVGLFKFITPRINSSRFLGSLTMAVIEIIVICNVNITFIMIIESVFLVLTILNGIRHFSYMLKRRKIKKSWLKYHSDLNGLDQLIYTKKILYDMIFRISGNKEGRKMPEREKSISDAYPQIDNAISKAYTLFENNEISAQSMIDICKYTIHSIDRAFDSNLFEPEYLDITIPAEIRNLTSNNAEHNPLHSEV